MIEQYVPQLFSELSLGTCPPFEKNGSVQLKLFSHTIEVLPLDPGAHFSAPIAPLPVKEREEFLLEAMKANFLGQGTGGGVIGLKEDESSLTLSLNLPYEMNYRTFKEALEEFINYLEFWKKETLQYVGKNPLGLK